VDSCELEDMEKQILLPKVIHCTCTFLVSFGGVGLPVYQVPYVQGMNIHVLVDLASNQGPGVLTVLTHTDVDGLSVPL
jgi:hypothetical protein